MHPNSLANLRPAWKPGDTPNPGGFSGQRNVDKALAMAQKACPKAARLIVQAISNEELPMSTRLRCAEYVLDKALPSQKGSEGASLVLSGGGVEWLELRFVKPGSEQPPTISTTYEQQPENASDDC